MAAIKAGELDRRIFSPMAQEAGRMKRIPVASSNVRSAGHDGDTLEIEFTSGGIYRYAGVSRADYEALLAAPSIGSYVAKHIKPHFVAEKVEAETKTG